MRSPPSPRRFRRRCCFHPRRWARHWHRALRRCRHIRRRKPSPAVPAMIDGAATSCLLPKTLTRSKYLARGREVHRAAPNAEKRLICRPRCGREGGSVDRDEMHEAVTLRPLAGGCAAFLILMLGAHACEAADALGGSLALTSDYAVRGVSRSNQEPALQLDVHYLTTSGLLVGAFASNTQMASRESKDAELDAFLGWVWSAGDEWRGRLLLSHYAYPWNEAHTGYDYDELDVDVDF